MFSMLFATQSMENIGKTMLSIISMISGTVASEGLETSKRQKINKYISFTHVFDPFATQLMENIGKTMLSIFHDFRNCGLRRVWRIQTRTHADIGFTYVFHLFLQPSPWRTLAKQCCPFSMISGTVASEALETSKHQNSCRHWFYLCFPPFIATQSMENLRKDNVVHFP